MERLKGGIFITAKEIQLLTGYSIDAARKEHRTIRDILGKTKGRLTVREYCDYFELDYQEIVNYLNPYR